MSGRTVTLVVCDAKGVVLGELEPFRVATPWWQEVEPIQQRYPRLVVLRLLDGTLRPSEPGAHVRYLAEAVHGAEDLPLRASRVVIDGHALRMPWARPGGPTADLAWAARILEPTGSPTQHRTWNLSAIWSIPSGAGRVWLKCVPGFFAHEAPVLRALRGREAPELVASDGQRMLLADLPGRDGYESTVDESCQLIDHLVRLQLATVAMTPALLRAGVPDARWPALLAELCSVVARRAPGDPDLRRLLDTAERRMRAIDECGLGDVLVHGDAHPGNARIGVMPPIWFDWGDSRIGHPLLDMAVAERLDPTTRERIERHWLATWAAAVPGSDPYRAWALLRPLAVLRMAAVFQMFLDGIEPSERVYHLDDVQPALARASGLAAAEPARG